MMTRQKHLRNEIIILTPQTTSIKMAPPKQIDMFLAKRKFEIILEATARGDMKTPPIDFRKTPLCQKKSKFLINLRFPLTRLLGGSKLLVGIL